MKIFAISFLVMLAMMVAGTTSAAGTSDTSEASNASTQPSLHEVKAMFTEAAKFHDDDVAPADPQRATLGPDDNYIIQCGSYIRSFMCWYYNNTRCYSGHLSSDEPDCLENCQCIQWDQAYWGPANSSDLKLPIDTPSDSESSRTDERSLDQQATPTIQSDREKRTKTEDPGLYDLSCHAEDQIAICHGVGVDCDQNGQITGPHVASCSPPICACHRRQGRS